MTTMIAKPPVEPARRGLWDREFEHYPSNRARFTSLGIVVLATITLYYQFYVAGGVATRLLVDFQMSFLYFVGINVLASVTGAASAIAAGLTDKYGRANVVVVGIFVTSLLCVVGIPNANSALAFSILYILLGFVEGVVLVATPALVRDFSPQLGRASAMGFWTLGPVFGSLLVAMQISNLPDSTAWQTHFVICGVFGLVVATLALLLLRELSPVLRDQLMVSAHDVALVEARAKGIDVQAAIEKPYRHMAKPDVILASIAISVFLIIYYLSVGFFPIYFQTNFGMTQADANALGNWSWSFLAVGLIAVGVLSDRLRVRKPFMLLGAIGALTFTVMFLSRTDNPDTSYGTLVWMLVGLHVSLGVAYAPWMASFTETVERRNPAMVATGLAIYGMIVRLIIATSILFVPVVITSVTDLVEKGPVASELATTYADELATAAKIDPATQAAMADPANAAAQVEALSQISGVPAADVGAVLQELEENPSSRPPVVKQHGAAVQEAVADLTALGKVPADDVAVLHEVHEAATDSPQQWRTYFWIAMAGQIAFIPLIFFMAGAWSPRRARREEEDHERWLQSEMAKLED